MITMRCQWELHTDEPTTPPDLFEQGDKLTEALLDHEKCNGGQLFDTSVSVDAGQGVVTAEFVITAQDLDEGMALNMAVMRSALHSIGASTPGWPSAESVVRYASPHMSLVPAAS